MAFKLLHGNQLKHKHFKDETHLSFCDPVLPGSLMQSAYLQTFENKGCRWC